MKFHTLQYDSSTASITVEGHTTDGEGGEKLGDSKGSLNVQ